MGDVVHLRKSNNYAGQVCPCGSAWWVTSGVTIGSDGRVDGYIVPLCCRDCGKALTDV